MNTHNRASHGAKKRINNFSARTVVLRILSGAVVLTLLKRTCFYVEMVNKGRISPAMAIEHTHKVHSAGFSGS
jgi:hypothetical protein